MEELQLYRQNEALEKQRDALLAILYNTYTPPHCTPPKATKYPFLKHAASEEEQDCLRSRPLKRRFEGSPPSPENHVSMLSPARVETRDPLTTEDELPDYEDPESPWLGQHVGSK
ncbi:predicted protein [Pyrenophora tritici-repentis Pt-1C-BFP]|uniref:Uncharacterized protein n=1 Tax=Pyrenophora tritici-repentis (strain Pt-1C-BFP) TaxID=426418 RepID=B2WP78_PYRTR|nr:uncharacterized protein PTRG_11788 [Pyrenophora tritici-repentis Pt-1C-BFP]EDU45944.1 predicted protein [Pyrenophora tritici-repentis Pt-1C-BFP]